MKRINTTMTDENKIYLKSKGISISKFLDQAIEAHKKDKWAFDYMQD